MGAIFDLLTEINNYDIVLEADDITTDAESGASDVLGKDSGGDSGSKDSGDIDLNTDDLLGTKNGDADEDGDPTNPDKDDDNSDSENNEDSDTDDMGEDSGDDENQDSDGGDSTDPTQDDSLDDKSDDFEYVRKKKLHKQLNDFYNVIDSDIKLLSEYVPKISDEKTVTTLYNVNKSLLQCKDYTYKILTEEFQTSEYPILLKKYISLNRVYELSIKILETYFDSETKDKRVKFNKLTKKIMFY